jgi:hypothetical protein
MINVAFMALTSVRTTSLYTSSGYDILPRSSVSKTVMHF